jgi:hypothetical protein
MVNRFGSVNFILALVLTMPIMINAAYARQNPPETLTPMPISDDRGIPMVFMPEGTFNMGITLDDAVENCASLVPERFVSQACSENVFEEFSSISEPQVVTVSSFYID